MASPTTMEDLPDNVLSNIFIRLLAKEVLQMRCVSKPWNTLLSHPSFIKLHLNHSLENNDSILLFFGSMISFELCPKPFTPRPSSSPHLQLPNSIQLPLSLQNGYGCGSIIGSINGLICFYYMSCSDDKYNAIHIWNPSLSTDISLPSSPLPSCFLQFGFGFDPKTNDYKVLKLTTFRDSPNMAPLCEVYSMRKGSWDLISERFPSHIKIFEGRDQVCVHDHLHWLSYTSKDIERPLTILGFDLGDEVFIEVPLPENILDCNWFNRKIVLGVLGGKLCVISRLRDGEWEVWVMEDYGVAESWVKHQGFPPFSGDIFPYGFTSKGEFVFQVDEDGDCMRFGLYDPIETKTKTFKITWRYCSISRFVEYVDSLVWFV